ncbi:hypothetical protein BGZ60DRAFT_435429 [Tricladium varicosporioides]|nr:hypothetical protein BGZ60DRAFT_435429 [Hymenoscyphus varicosporioides]
MSATKRKYDPNSPGQLYSNKSRSRPTAEARVDPTYGQRSAIPGLDDETGGDDDSDSLNYDEDGSNALSYLRAVRQEAFSIPNLLVAPKQEGDDRDVYENGVGDYRGIYGDGAYYAVPEASQDSEEENESTIDPNLDYFDSILTRYEALHHRLAQTPPPENVKILDKDHPTYVGRLNTEIARWWRWKMRTVDPLPAQIATMDKSTVLRLLGLLTGGNLLKRGLEVELSVSQWIWSLLARLPDRGELTSEEIGIIRELGKKAVLVGMGMKDDETLNQGMDEVEAGLAEQEEEILDVVNDTEISLENGESGVEEFPVSSANLGSYPPNIPGGPDGKSLEHQTSSGAKSSIMLPGPRDADVTTSGSPQDTNINISEVEDTHTDDLETMKAKMLANLILSQEEDKQVTEELVAAEAKKAMIRWNTKATVDMIITITGEIYGQRDLLEFRAAWDNVV